MVQTMKTSVVVNGVTVEVEGLADLVVEGASVKVIVRNTPSYELTATPCSPWKDQTTAVKNGWWTLSPSGHWRFFNDPAWVYRTFGEAAS